MYSNKVHQSILHKSKPNLNSIASHLHNVPAAGLLFKCGQIVRESVLTGELLVRRVFLSAPPRSTNVLRVWSRQCECVVAQRVRRGQQMFSLYTKLWEEQALMQFLNNMRRQVARRGREFMFSAVGLGMYNWDNNRIPDDEMQSHFGEMEYIKILKDKTVMCRICLNSPEAVNNSVVIFCDCEGRKSSLDSYDNWSLFIEQPDLIVWRRLHPSGSFEYKVYGTYNDVSAEDFLSVQIDTRYRKDWDPTAVSLEVIEKDEQIGSNSDLVYWEMQWPRLFANRDYVFKRRFLVDKAKKRVMLLSKGTEHPSYPTSPKKFRVSDYWSSMVIKPYTEINKPGIEFSLTYFDNPGVNIPSAVTSWVAYRAMPDFLTRLRAATLKYKDYCAKHKCCSIYSYDDCNPFELQETGSLLDIVKEEFVSKRPNFHLDKQINLLSADDVGPLLDEEDDDDEVEVVINKGDGDAKLKDPKPEPPDTIVNNNTSNAIPPEVILAPSQITQADQSYWKYLHPTYYIS